MTRFPRPELLAAVVYALLFLLWYPPVFGIIDESTYLSTASVYRAGTIYSDVAGVSSLSRVPSGDHTVTKFAPLWPLVLVPFTAIGWRGAFGANLLLHLVGFAVFVRLVRAASLPRWTALLYLAHPTLVYYSRTLMSDVAAGVPVLLAWLLWRRHDRRAAVGAGLWLGVSCLVRYTNVVLAVVFAIAAAADEIRRGTRGRGGTAPLLLGLAPSAIALAVYNHVVFGRWWRGSDGYRDDRAGIGMEGQFGWHVFGDGLEHYAVALLVVVPLLLLGVVFYRGRDRLVLRTVAIAFTLFFCFYYYHDRADGFLSTAVVGLRFLIPVLGLYLLAYAELLDRVLRRTGVSSRVAAVVVAVAAVVGTATVHARHDERLETIAARRDALYAATTDGSVVLCDTAARKLLHDAWGARTPVRVEFRGRWAIPDPGEVGGGGAIFVALGDGGDVPAEVERLLDSSGAESVPVEAPGELRLWSVPRPR